MRVEVRTYATDPEGYLTETWTLDKDGRAVCDDAWTQETMEIHGVTTGGKNYYPKDGESFLRNLPYEYFNSSFTRAVVIE